MKPIGNLIKRFRYIFVFLLLLLISAGVVGTTFLLNNVGTGGKANHADTLSNIACKNFTVKNSAGTVIAPGSILTPDNYVASFSVAQIVLDNGTITGEDLFIQEGDNSTAIIPIQTDVRSNTNTLIEPFTITSRAYNANTITFATFLVSPTGGLLIPLNPESCNPKYYTQSTTTAPDVSTTVAPSTTVTTTTPNSAGVAGNITGTVNPATSSPNMNVTFSATLTTNVNSISRIVCYFAKPQSQTIIASYPTNYNSTPQSTYTVSGNYNFKYVDYSELNTINFDCIGFTKGTDGSLAESQIFNNVISSTSLDSIYVNTTSTCTGSNSTTIVAGCNNQIVGTKNPTFKGTVCNATKGIINPANITVVITSDSSCNWQFTLPNSLSYGVYTLTIYDANGSVLSVTTFTIGGNLPNTGILSDVILTFVIGVSLIGLSIYLVNYKKKVKTPTNI